jgi:hypothetical protein
MAAGPLLRALAVQQRGGVPMQTKKPTLVTQTTTMSVDIDSQRHSVVE